MRLTRNYVDAPMAPDALIDLPEATAGHLLRVLRLGEGDACVLFNGDGADYHAVLQQVGKRGASARIVERRALRNESPLRVTLAQAVARGEKMDWILQKATELGVAAIAPIVTERTEVRLDGERSEKRLAHWRGVIASACEQSGRARLPTLSPPTALATYAAGLGADCKLLLDPEADAGIDRLPLRGDSTVALVVGPEGGLSERDLAALRAAGFQSVRLGPRILRTETAGLAVIAALQALYGDWRAA